MSFFFFFYCCLIIKNSLWFNNLSILKLFLSNLYVFLNVYLQTLHSLCDVLALFGSGAMEFLLFWTWMVLECYILGSVASVSNRCKSTHHGCSYKGVLSVNLFYGSVGCGFRLSIAVVIPLSSHSHTHTHTHTKKNHTVHATMLGPFATYFNYHHF